MDLLEAMKARHSVRRYEDKSIEPEIREKMNTRLMELNAESGLNITIAYDDPSAFSRLMSKAAGFVTVKNFIVLKGMDCADFEERCGYYGELLVLYAQTLGLNTCWVALTFNSKGVLPLIPKEERFCMVIALGYGQTMGRPHRNKKEEQLCDLPELPDWLRPGLTAAMSAPTAMNQQKFKLRAEGETPVVEIAGHGPYTAVDLGIVKCHVALATGRNVK